MNKRYARVKANSNEAEKTSEQWNEAAKHAGQKGDATEEN